MVGFVFKVKKFLNLGEAFDEIVKLYPNNTALIFPDYDQEITYNDLNIFVDKLIQSKLLDQVNLGELILIINDKSFECLSLMIACLKLGIIYTNIDPEMPILRIKKIIDKTKPKLIVTNDNKYIKPINGQEIVSVKSLIDNKNQIKRKIKTILNGSEAAYVMFTSGSTGEPKGVVISQLNILNFIEWSTSYFEISERDKFSSVNPIYFDNSVFDFFNSIFNGSSLIIISSTSMKSPDKIVQQLTDYKCTIWFSVPSLLIYLLTMKVIDKCSFPNIRKIIFGGEGFPKKKLFTLFNLYKERATLENVYGPTECTCICSAHKINEQDFNQYNDLAPLGKLNKFFKGDIIYNSKNSINGELVLYGPNVGLGYYNDKEKSKKFFIQNPNNLYYRDIGYKTGDIVREENDELIFIGRKDSQFKHLGYRIEPGEIEAAINALEGVNECAVVYRENQLGIKSIKAYISFNQKADENEIKNHLKKVIPQYMIPKYIEFCRKLPKNSNGKIDRKQLT
tara:strand:- start:1784 stop:3307 length:1524 start_codon:yes stop_codon:yes gene_type:complete